MIQCSYSITDRVNMEACAYSLLMLVPKDFVWLLL